MRLDARRLIPLLLSVVIGIAMTSISGLFKTPFTRIGVDVVQRGMRMPWIIQVIPRTGQIMWIRFLADFVFWTFTYLASSFAATLLVIKRDTGDQATSIS